MSTVGVSSPSPASIVGSDTNGGTFPLTETPPPGYMSEDGDTQEPADLMSKKIVILTIFCPATTKFFSLSFLHS
jgi:hypothetical protein